MADDIVTRLRAGDGDDIVLFGMMYEAADEIERLRAELQHSALQTNVMRNIATAPYGGSAQQIADLGAELAEFRRLRAENDGLKIRIHTLMKALDESVSDD